MKIPDGMVDYAKKVLGIAQSTDVELNPFAGRGSDRSYYRLRWNGTQSAVLAHYNPARRENASFADIARFLDDIEIPIAHILGHEPMQCFLVIQDLGKTDLWSLSHLPWENRRALYQKTLAVANRLHSYPVELVPGERVQLAEAFGPELYCWERDYFLENFVGKLCKIMPEPLFLTQLATELAALAERLSSLRQCLVHRDLQSQNVMIWRNKPFLIDYQGMRRGTLFYDLGSLLYDPYVSLSENEREELLLFYFRISKEETDWVKFREAFREASAQRLMQALGAYGFLGMTRGLKSYLKHVRPGVENLCLVSENAGTLPYLYDLAARCRKKLAY
ncbi:MAG: phosphotransferase [Acidobacteriota bacterium]|jgi:aminoglycoside/choline kinase family phosphotransferase